MAAQRRGRLVLLLAVLGSVLTLLATTVDSASADSYPRPTKIVIDSITSDAHQAPSGTPNGSVPYVLVQAGDTFSINVSFQDATGAPAAFTQNTPLTISSNQGTLSQTSGIAPKGATSATLQTSMLQPANQVSLTVAAGSKSAKVTPGTSAPSQLFDVLSEIRPFNGTAPAVTFQGGIGGDDQSCTNPTSANPVCGVLILAHGAQSSQVLMSLGKCDSSYAGCGSTRGSVVQVLADLGGLYTRTDPAELVVKCDKSVCGSGAINKQTLSFSTSGNGALTRAPACPAKGTVGADQQACVDYVQSTRDNSDDTLLYLLFPNDMRGSVG
jgi:hypothetical protein